MTTPPQTYIYGWRNNSKRATLYGRECVVRVRLPMNSALVEFIDNGQREVISRNALRKTRKGGNETTRGMLFVR